jgi:predicted aspartyl protease
MMGVARKASGAGRCEEVYQRVREEDTIVKTETMGKVLVTAKIENLQDVYDAERGLLPDEQVRRFVVPDAVVDTGATTLLLPKRLIAALGLRPLRVRHSRGLGGDFLLPLYGTVWLTIQDRYCAVDVGEIGDEYPVLVGQILLEALDWVIDPTGQQLIGNPDHHGEWGLDTF